jgi:hypothetical protein
VATTKGEQGLTYRRAGNHDPELGNEGKKNCRSLTPESRPDGSGLHTDDPSTRGKEEADGNKEEQDHTRRSFDPGSAGPTGERRKESTKGTLHPVLWGDQGCGREVSDLVIRGQAAIPSAPIPTCLSVLESQNGFEEDSRNQHVQGFRSGSESTEGDAWLERM